MKIRISGIIILFLLTVNAFAESKDLAVVLQKINLPEGFNISIFADNVPNARSISYGGDGIVYVGARKQGQVFALRDKDGDGRADEKYLLVTGLLMPNGVAFHEGALYVAETDRIIRFDAINQSLSRPPKPVVVYDKFPNKKHHGWKYLAFGPDGKLYTAVGVPCNICKPEKEIFGTLVRMNPDGSDFEIIARGIRNTVGYDWHPKTGELYFTENGRDYLGDDAPPDELNIWTTKGAHYGYPYCHGGFLLDPEFGKGKNCKDYQSPKIKFKAHMAPLGIHFYHDELFPSSYNNQLFVAQHGSWNRSIPHGYRIALVKFVNNKPVKEEVFADGWLTEQGRVLGRPVDILGLPDGSLLVSDDALGVIYRISYSKK